MININLKNNVVLVTGGNQGLGKSIVKKLAEINATVLFLDKNRELGETLEKELKVKGLQIKFIPLDLRNYHECCDCISKIYDEFGRIDILINNARAGQKLNLLDETEENWDESIDVMLKGTFFLSQEVIKVMRKASKGVILNIASIAASNVCGESPSYHIAKAGLIQMTRYLAIHAGPMGIRTNAIAPGFIVKDENIKKYHSEKNENYRKIVSKCHPLGDIGTSNDITQAILFLCSEAASFINGEILYIDGGLTVHDPFALATNVVK